ncbi:MAG: chemotaxis response regulator protein-glutamate methylesterase [Beijerinckiaceae bacterium]
MSERKQVRVLIVDDSATTRALIREVLASDPLLKVVGEATNPLEAREAIKVLNPDVMTLDIEMPHMNGLDFLEKVMALRPFPVIMVSNFTDRGAEETIRALELGAVDYIAKPTPRRPGSLNGLPARIRAAARAKVHVRNLNWEKNERPASVCYQPNGAIVAVGASTGGVDALIEVISRFPSNCPPTLVRIHMPAMFTAHFARRLDRISKATVREASDGDVLQPGKVFIAPGSIAHLQVSRSPTAMCRLRGTERINGHRPSVDVLFHSVARRGQPAVGVILTGMGNDGADGLLAMRKAGASTIGQDAATSVVYGMPRVAFEIGAVQQQLRIEQIADAILSLTGMAGKEDKNA